MKKYQLPKEFATKWVEALETADESIHCRGVYHNTKSCQYCAMGLGLVKNDIPLNSHGDNVADGEHDYFMDNPISVNGISIWYAIYDLNDNLQMTFKEIAQWVKLNVDFI